MIIRKMTVFLLIFIIFGCAEDEKAVKNKKTLIKVDNHTMSLAEFNDAFELSQMISEQAQVSDARSEQLERLRFLRQLVEEMIILRRGEELDLVISEPELSEEIDKIRKDYPDKSFDEIFLKEAISYKQWEDKIRKRLLVEKVIQTDLIRNISVSAEEIKAYYKEHEEEFSRPETARVYQILLPTKDQAKKILAEIEKGASFQDMARTHSISPDKDNSGDLGFVPKGILTEVLDEAIFKLKVGKISPVIKSGYGYHLFLVTEKKPASKPDLARSTEIIRKRIKEEKLDQVYGTWLTKLRSRYDIQISERLLR